MAKSQALLKKQKEEYRVLVLPSGGATGIIPATLLERLEQETGTPIHQLFHEIWGSSIGSMIAALLTTSKDGKTNRPRPAIEVVRFIEETFSRYHRAARIRSRFKKLIGSKKKLNETLIPIRVLSAKVTDWRARVLPKETELASFFDGRCNGSSGSLSLSSIVCGSCTIPPIHRAEPLDLGNGELAHYIDAGHEYCGKNTCMNPLFTFIKELSISLDLERYQVSIFFLGNGWVNLHPSWGVQGNVNFKGHDDRPFLVQLYNVRADLASTIQKWKKETKTGNRFKFVKEDYVLFNMAGIGVIPTGTMKTVAEDIANQEKSVFRLMVNHLKKVRASFND